MNQFLQRDIWHLLQDGIGQRLQSGFASHLCTGATLLLIGQIDVLQRRRIPAVFYPLPQFGSELSLRVDGREDELLAVHQLVDIVEFGCHLSHLHVGHAARSFLAVATDEGHSSPVLKQIHHLPDVFLLESRALGYEQTLLAC